MISDDSGDDDSGDDSGDDDATLGELASTISKNDGYVFGSLGELIAHSRSSEKPGTSTQKKVVFHSFICAFKFSCIDDSMYVKTLMK